MMNTSEVGSGQNSPNWIKVPNIGIQNFDKKTVRRFLCHNDNIWWYFVCEACEKQIFGNNPHISCLDQWFVDYVFALAIDVEEGYYDTEGVANNVNDNDQGAIDNEQDQPSSNDDQHVIYTTLTYAVQMLSISFYSGYIDF